MSRPEILLWAREAAKLIEKSWHQGKGRYQTSMTRAIHDTRPVFATDEDWYAVQVLLREHYSEDTLL